MGSGYNGSGQKPGQFFDPWSAAQPWRGITAGANFILEMKVFAPSENMQPGMGVALGGEEFVLRAEILLEDRNTESIPEPLSILLRQRCSANVGEHHNGLLDGPAVGSHDPQLVERTGDRARMEALASLIPALRKNTHEASLTKARREYSGAWRGMDRVNEVCTLGRTANSDYHSGSCLNKKVPR